MARTNRPDVNEIPPPTGIRARTRLPRGFVGIDPGGKGGIAVISDDLSIAEAYRYPGDYSSAAGLLLDLSARFDITAASIERVSAMPGNGVSSMFKFGANFGAWLGMLAILRIPHYLITPRSWQKVFLDAGTGETKTRSLNMARRLFPKVEMKFAADDGKADALHLARHARQEFLK